MKIKNKFQFFYTLFNNPTPVYVILYITSHCNQKCKMCFYWENIENFQKRELTLDELKKISENFDNIIQLSITGGEPFLREDLPEIVDIFITNNNVKYITIPTNASMPDRIATWTERMLKQHHSTLFKIALAIDGIGEKHDSIRGANGAFLKLIETYDKLIELRQRYNNIIINMNTTYSVYNEGEILNILEYVKENFNIDNYNINLARGNTRNPEAKGGSFETYKKIINMLKRNYNKEEARPFSSLLRAVVQKCRETLVKSIESERMIIPCMAGDKVIIIEEEGDVYPCEILKKFMGNLRKNEYDIKKILNSQRTKDIIKYIKKLKCYCTFECAMIVSVMFHKKSYSDLFWKAVKNFIKIKYFSNNSTVKSSA